MTEKWHKGPPPSVGWWPVESKPHGGAIRWWDGEHWSIQFRAGDTGLFKAAEAAGCRSPFGTDVVEWQHRPASWPARSKT